VPEAVNDAFTSPPYGGEVNASVLGINLQKSTQTASPRSPP